MPLSSHILRLADRVAVLPDDAQNIFTHQILSMVPGLETVNTWASLHHERLDGRGYPFRTRDIPLGARIVAVADIFTAITENRPYRAGMERTQCLAVLDQLVSDGAIDGDVVAVLRGDFEEIHHIRALSQQTFIPANFAAQQYALQSEGGSRTVAQCHR